MSGSRVVHLALYEGLSDWECGHLLAHLNTPFLQQDPRGFTVRTVALGMEPVTTMGGMRILPDMTLEALAPEDSCLLILPGSPIAAGGGIAPFVAMASRFLEAGVPVAAICGATVALGRAGLLDGMPHTSNAREILEGPGYLGGAHYVDAPAVTGGRLVTASGLAPVHFALEVFRMLDVYAPGRLQAWEELFLHRDPLAYHRLMAEG